MSKVWTKEEEKYILNNYHKLSVSLMAKKLDRTPNAVLKRLKSHLQGKAKPRKNHFGQRRYSMSGWRDTLGLAVRSKWEANVLIYLKHKKKRWEYEPEVFYFEGERRGAISYTPDIKLSTGRKKSDYIWIEVKGHLDSKSRSKIRKFKKYYPEEFEKLHCIIADEKVEAAAFFEKMDIPVYLYYNELEQNYSHLKGWEF